MSRNINLNAAKRAKNDEFYTQLSDIEKEMKHYRDHFKDKVIFCNCDDPKWSNFWYYFDSNFEYLGLKKLISTHFDPEKDVSYKLATYIGESGIKITTEEPIYGDEDYPPGDFRSNDCVELLKEADIVVTNPPFSLFGEYVAQLIKHNKKFLILGNQNAITYKETFPLLKDNKMWLGYCNGSHEFKVPKDYSTGTLRIDEAGEKYAKLGNICWYTNLDLKKRHEDLILYKTYKGNEKDYPKYDNYDAINVNKVSEIPMDYDGAMGVPITFLDKYNPSQFEILGIDSSFAKPVFVNKKMKKVHRFYINDKQLYARILIKKSP